MRRRSQERVRTYYYRTREELLKRASGSQAAEARVHTLLSQVHDRLRAHTFYACYLDRSAPLNERLCSTRGVFTCAGRWDLKRCARDPAHSINPYSSREHRIVFQTWNLDHRVERTRALVPALAHALALSSSDAEPLLDEARLEELSDVAFRYLFTTYNLRLVHVVCHDKGEHRQANKELVLKLHSHLA